MTVYLDYPFRVDALGGAATTNLDDHVRDMIEQLLFTNPGERVNRPDFGSGLLQLVFAPNSAELAAAVEFTLQAALQQYLGDVIDVAHLSVEADDAVLRVTVSYTVKATGQAATAVVSTRPGQ
jgi:phage baseplate assembly protein W